MMTGSSMDQTNDPIIYSFRFGTAQKLVHLNQQQLHRIPYLSSLVVHNDSCISAKNEDGEYILHPSIRYNWFKAILSYVTTEHPSALFTELSEEADVLKMMNLYDYLCINPLSVPLLKDQHLFRRSTVDPEDEETDIEYERGTVLEARDTAVQFIIAVMNNEYDLDDSTTIQKIFDLVVIILSNCHVFGQRLCHHAFAVTKECCFPFFSCEQRSYLNSALQLIRRNKKTFTPFSPDDNQSLPRSFHNVFAWRGAYVLRIKNDSESLMPPSLLSLGSTNAEDFNRVWHLPSLTNHYQFLFHRQELQRYFILSRDSLRDIENMEEEILSFNSDSHIKERDVNEAKSARSGHFNTLPKRPKVDKFKHRFNSKTQKYR